MDAERLIALEAALAELGSLYTAARTFTALEQSAEEDLLPQLSELSSGLRALNRGDRLSQADIDTASRAVLEVRAKWQARLDSVRASDEYRQAVAAHHADDQTALAAVIPRIFAGVDVTAPPQALYFGISVAVRRRGPGTSPFLSADACADKIETTAREGLTPPAHGGEWWDEDLPSIACAGAFGDLDGPFALVTTGAIGHTIFADVGDLGYRIFSKRVTNSFRVEIADEADDEWWQAYEQSYRELRDEVCALLTQRGVPHSVVLRG